MPVKAITVAMLLAIGSISATAMEYHIKDVLADDYYVPRDSFRQRVHVIAVIGVRDALAKSLFDNYSRRYAANRQMYDNVLPQSPGLARAFPEPKGVRLASIEGEYQAYDQMVKNTRRSYIDSMSTFAESTAIAYVASRKAYELVPEARVDSVKASSKQCWEYYENSADDATMELHRCYLATLRDSLPADAYLEGEMYFGSTGEHNAVLLRFWFHDRDGKTLWDKAAEIDRDKISPTMEKILCRSNIEDAVHKALKGVTKR